MKLPTDFATWFENYPNIWLGVLIIVAIAAIGRFIGGLAVAKSLLADIMKGGVEIDWNTRQVTVSDWLGWLVLFLLAVFIYGLVIAYRSSKGLEELRQTSGKRNLVVEKTFEKTVLASSRICGQLYPRSRTPQKNFLKVKTVYLVDEDFTTSVTREYEISAITDLDFDQFVIGAEPEADPCEFLDEIDFKVRDTNPLNELVYLITENTPYTKRVAVFFLPHINPGDAPRTIVLTYKWPRMLRRLVMKGSEIGNWILNSRDPVPAAELAVYFAPKVKNRVECVIHGQRLGEDRDRLIRGTCDMPGCGGWEGWRYLLTNAPPGEYKLEFRYK